MNSKKSILYIVHCIDTEGPLSENLSETFKRINNIFKIKLRPSVNLLKQIQNQEINLPRIEAISKLLKPSLLNYNDSWAKINQMLNKCLSKEFRYKFKDDFGNGWVYSWHCMDHVLYKSNPRKKSLGYGKVFNFYKKKLKQTSSKKDEINWHFHPISINDSPLSCATSYENSFSKIHNILCRRIIDHKWFPVVNRQGFNSTRPDSHLFLEQWIPFDYSNMSINGMNDQPDLNDGRFGDWRRAPKNWDFYNPDFFDYQKKGGCNRKIFRCLNIGTRFNNITDKEIENAFNYSQKNKYAVLAITNHDYRDIIDDVENLRNSIFRIKKKYDNVLIKFCGAEQAAIECTKKTKYPEVKFKIKIYGNKLFVHLLSGKIFGPQPYLAIKTINQKYFHDNFDIVKKDKIWSYTFDNQTFAINKLRKIGVGSAGKHGGYCVKVINLY